MKKNYFIYIISAFLVLLNSSCEDFLDKSHDMGLTEDDIYVDYNSIMGYLDYGYKNYLVNYHNDYSYENGRNYFGGISDEFATLLNSSAIKDFHTGNWLLKNKSNAFELGCQGNTIISKSYQGIRMANRVIHNHEKIGNITGEQKNWVLGQAHFYRAWFYFQLITRYGGMPILDKVFTGNGDDDIPRQTYHESHEWMVQDINAAIEMLPEFWNDNNSGRPNKVAAMAFKSMAMLYDASPLMQNDLHATVVKGYDQERAAEAARAADELLEYLKVFPKSGAKPPYNYRLVDGTEYKNIFYFQRGEGANWIHPEHLWFNRNVVEDKGLMIRRYWLFFTTETFTGADAASGFMPTQNMVDLFEKKGSDGLYYPITDERAEYDHQNPYQDRDPRLMNNVIVPAEEWGEKNGAKFYFTTYKDGEEYKTINSNSNTNQRGQTGYICKKFLWPECNDFTKQYNKYHIITAYIRYAQVYLDYAEASFEATGNATQRVSGCNMTAEEALNVVRNRVGLTGVAPDIVADPVKFRETLRRERTVELMFENHRWFDIRRWMIMHTLFQELSPIKGMLATPTETAPFSATSPENANLEFTYQVVPLTPEVRGYGMKNYWYPFTISEISSLRNLVQNPGW